MGRRKDTCWSCKNSFLGRCFHENHYGEDISVNYSNCDSYIDGREPKEIKVVAVAECYKIAQENGEDTY